LKQAYLKIALLDLKILDYHQNGTKFVDLCFSIDMGSSYFVFIKEHDGNLFDMLCKVSCNRLGVRVPPNCTNTKDSGAGQHLLPFQQEIQCLLLGSHVLGSTAIVCC
jgi:hypothetical protein